MIYLPGPQALFVHNPKCAGTTLTEALEDAFPDAVKLWGRAYLPQQDTIRDLAHLGAHEAPAFLGRARPIRVSFGIVRNPYDRFRSALAHFQRYSGSGTLSAEAFVERYLDHTTIRSDWRLVHFRPQYQFFFQDGRPVVDHVWDFASLATIGQELSGLLGRDVKLGRVNVAEVPGPPLSDQLVAIVNRLYARDFEAFGFPMRPVASAWLNRGPYADFDGLWPEERGLDCSHSLMT